MAPKTRSTAKKSPQNKAATPQATAEKPVLRDPPPLVYADDGRSAYENIYVLPHRGPESFKPVFCDEDSTVNHPPKTSTSNHDSIDTVIMANREHQSELGSMPEVSRLRLDEADTTHSSSHEDSGDISLDDALDNDPTHSTIREDSGDIRLDDAPSTEIDFEKALHSTQLVLRAPLGSCPRHCTRDVAARLFRQIPSSSSHDLRNKTLARLERLSDIKEEEAAEWHCAAPPLGMVAAELAAKLDEDRDAYVRQVGDDPQELDECIRWAKWASKAAKAEVFHEWTERCGTIAEQVEMWGMGV